MFEFLPCSSVILCDDATIVLTLIFTYLWSWSAGVTAVCLLYAKRSETDRTGKMRLSDYFSWAGC